MKVGSPKHAILLAPLLALAFVGCGGGDDEPSEPVAAETSEPAALSKQELLAQGDAICAEVNAAIGTIGSTSTEAAGQAVQASNLYAGLAERLEGLGAPSDEATGYPQVIAAAKQLAQAESDAALAAERGEDPAAAEAEAASALSSFQEAADAFGFDACGQEPSAPRPRDDPSGNVSGGGEVEEGGVEAAPEVVEEEAPAPETGGGGGVEGGTGGGAAPGGGSGGGEGSSGGIGPG